MLNNYEDTSSGFTNSHVQTPASIPRSVETQKQQNIGPTWSYNSQLEGLYSCYQNEHQPVYNIHSMGHFEGNAKHNNNPYPQYSSSSLHQPVPTPIGKCHEACCQHLSERYPINPAPLRYPPNGSVQPPRYGEISGNDHRQYFTERRPMQASISRKKEFQSENGYSNASHDRHFQFVGRGQIHVPERQSMQMIRSQYPMYPINSYWSPRNWSGPRMSYPPPPPYHQSVTNQTNQLQNNLKMGEPPHYIDSSVSKSLNSQQRRAIMRNANANPEIVRPIPETKRPPGNGSHVQGCYDFPYHSGFVPFNEVNKMSSNIPPQVNSSSCKVPLDKQFQQHQFKISNSDRSMSGCNNTLGEIAYAYPPESYMRNPSNGLQQMTDSRKLSLQYEQQSLGKKRPDLDVRQFLATWDDDEEDSTRISEPIHNNNNIAPYIVVDCRSLEGEAAAKLQERLKGTSTQNFQSKPQNESPNSLNNAEPKGTVPNDIILRDTDPQRSLIHSEYGQGNYGSTIHVDSDKNLPFWNPENRENCPETDTIMGKGAFQPLDCTKRDNMNVVEPLVASKRDSHMHGDMNHKLINNDSTNHMSFDALVTYYGDSRRVSDGSYDLVEMTERLVNASDKICTIERNPLEQEMPGEGLHPCDPRNLQNQIGPNQTTYHHRLPSRYTSNNYQHYKSGIGNDSFFNFKYPVGSSKFFGFDSSNLDPNFDYHKTQADFVHQKSMLSKDKVIDNFQNNSLSKNLSKVDLQDMEKRGNVIDAEILKKQHSLNNYQISEKSNLDFVGVDPEQFITPIIIKKSDYYNKENDELKSSKINNVVMGQGNEKNVLMQSNTVESDILKMSHSSSNKHLFRETNIVTLHSGDQTESSTITVEVPYDEQYSSLVKLSEEITESGRSDSNMQEDEESKLVRSKPDSKEKSELAALKKPTSFKLKRLPNSKEWIKIGGDVSLESKNSESAIPSEAEKSLTVQDTPKPTVNLNMPSLDDIRFNDESENKSDSNAMSSLKAIDKNNEELSSFSKLTNNENKSSYKSDNVQLTQLAIVSPMKFPSKTEEDMTMRAPALADDISNQNKENFNSNEKNFATSDSQISNLTVQSKELTVNSEFAAIHSPYNTIALEEHARSPFMEMNRKLQNASDSQTNDDADIGTFISENNDMEHNYSDLKKMQSSVGDDYTTNQCLNMNNDEILCSGNTEHDGNKESFSSFHNYSECEMNSTMSEYFKLNNRMCDTDKDMEVCIPSSPGVEEMFEDINHTNNNDNTFLEKSEEMLFVSTSDSPVNKSPCCRSETFNSDAFIIHDSVDEQCTTDLPLDTTNSCSLNFDTEENDMFSKTEQLKNPEIEDNSQQSVKTSLNFDTQKNEEIFSKSEQSNTSKIEDSLQQNVKMLPVIPPINLKLNERKKIWCIAKKPKSFEVKSVRSDSVETKENKICHEKQAEFQNNSCNYSPDCGGVDRNSSHKLYSDLDSGSLPTSTDANNDLDCFSETINEEKTIDAMIDLSLQNESDRKTTTDNFEEEQNTNKEKQDHISIFSTSEDLKGNDHSINNSTFLRSELSAESNSTFLEFTEKDHRNNDNSFSEGNVLPKEHEVVQLRENLDQESILLHKNDDTISKIEETSRLKESVDNVDTVNSNESISVVMSSPSTKCRIEDKDFSAKQTDYLEDMSQNVDRNDEAQSDNKFDSSHTMLNLSRENNASDTVDAIEKIDEKVSVFESNSQDYYLKTDESARNSVNSSGKSFPDDNLQICNTENTEILSADFTCPDKENSCFNTAKDGQNDCDLFQSTIESNTNKSESIEQTEVNIENTLSPGNNEEFPIANQSESNDGQINIECQMTTETFDVGGDVSKNSSDEEKRQDENYFKDSSVNNIEMFEHHEEVQETVNCQEESRSEILTEENKIFASANSTFDVTIQEYEKCTKSSGDLTEEEKNVNITTKFNLESVNASENSENISLQERNVQENNSLIYPILKSNSDNELEKTHFKERTEQSTSSAVEIHDSDLIGSEDICVTSENSEKIFTNQEDCLEEKVVHTESDSKMECLDSVVSNETVGKSYLQKNNTSNLELRCNFECIDEDKSLECHESKKNILDDEYTIGCSELNNRIDKEEQSGISSVDNNKIVLLSPKMFENLNTKEIDETATDLDVAYCREMNIVDVNRSIDSNTYESQNTICESNNIEDHVIESEISNINIETSNSEDHTNCNVIKGINTNLTAHLDNESVLTNSNVCNINTDSDRSVIFHCNEDTNHEPEETISHSVEKDVSTVKGETVSVKHVHGDEDNESGKSLGKQNLDINESKEAKDDEEITMKVTVCCKNVSESQEDCRNTQYATKENEGLNSLEQKQHCSLKENEKHCVAYTSIRSEDKFEKSEAAVVQSPVNFASNVNSSLVEKEIADVRKCYEGTEIEYSSEELNFGINYETCANQAVDIANYLSSSEEVLTSERIKCNSDFESGSKDNSNTICLEQIKGSYEVMEMEDNPEVLLPQRKDQDEHLLEHTDVGKTSSVHKNVEPEVVTGEIRKELVTDESMIQTGKPLDAEISKEINKMCLVEATTSVSDCTLDLKRNITDSEVNAIFENRETKNLLDIQSNGDTSGTNVSKVNTIDPQSDEFCTNSDVKNIDENLNLDKSVANCLSNVLSEENNETEVCSDRTQSKVKNAEMFIELKHNSQTGNDMDVTSELILSEAIDKDQNNVTNMFTQNQGSITEGEISMLSIDNQNSNKTESITDHSKLSSEKECANEINNVSSFNEENVIDNNDTKMSSAEGALTDKEKNINLADQSNIVDRLNSNNNFEFAAEKLEENNEKCDVNGSAVKPKLVETKEDERMNCKELASNFETTHFKFNNSVKCKDLQLNVITDFEPKNSKCIKNESQISELKLKCRKPVKNIIKNQSTNVKRRKKNGNKNKDCKSNVNSKNLDEFIRHPDTLLFKVEKRENEVCDNKAVKAKLTSSHDVHLESDENFTETNCIVNSKLPDSFPVDNISVNNPVTDNNLDVRQTVITEEPYLLKEKDFDVLQTFDNDNLTSKTLKQVPIEEHSDSMSLSEKCYSCDNSSAVEIKLPPIKSPKPVSSDFLFEETVEKQMEALHSSQFTYSDDIVKIKEYHSSPLDSLESNFCSDNEVIDISSVEDKSCLKEIFTESSLKDDSPINIGISENLVQPTSPVDASPLIPHCNRTKCSEQNEQQLTSCTFYNTQFDNDLLLKYNTQLNRPDSKQVESNSCDILGTEKNNKRSNSILSDESISNMIKVQDMDTTPFQCLVEAALAVETAEKANKMAIKNSSKTCVESDNCSEVENQDFKQSETQTSAIEVQCNANSSLPNNFDFTVNKKKTKTKYRFPKPKIKTKKLKKNIARDYLNENECNENLKNLGGKVTHQVIRADLIVESLAEQETETIEKVHTEFFSPNNFDVCLKTKNKFECENPNEEYNSGTNNFAQHFSASKNKATQDSNSTDEAAEKIECSELENEVLYFHVNTEKVNECAEEFDLEDFKVLNESQQLNRDGIENEIDSQENLKLSNVDLETETNFVIIIEELETAESSEDFMEKRINIQNIVPDCDNLGESVEVDGTQVPVEIIVAPVSNELSNISVLDGASLNNTELCETDNVLEVSHQIGYDGLNANLSNDIANWPYVEEEVTHVDSNLETDKDIFLTNSNLISSIKCSLPWERIFNIANSKKRKLKHNKQTFSPNGLELGPAKIELRLASESGAWKVVNNKNNDCISPIVNVKRLILQRDPELTSYSEKESEEEIDLKERRQSFGHCSSDSLAKVNKKNETDNSSLIQITKDKRWQPIVVLTRSKELDNLCLDTKEHNEQPSRCSDSPSNSPYTSGVSKVNKKIKKKSYISQKVIEKKARSESFQKNDLEFNEEETFSQNPDRDDHFSFTDSIDPAQEYVWRCLDNEEDWMDHSPLQNYCDQKSEKDSFEEDEISFDGKERRNSFSDHYSVINDSNSKRMPENGEIVETEYVNSKSKDWKHLQDSESTCSKESVIDARKSDLLHNLSLIFSKNRNRGVKRPSEGHSKEDTKRRRRQKIEKYPFHCRKCCIGFKMKEEMVRHKDSRHPPHRELHHCLLCQRSFSSSLRHSLHVEGRSHRHLELVQRHTMHAVHKLLTGVDFPRIRPLSNSERLALDWRPNQPGCIHYYHQLTPLQVALQDYSTSQKSSEGQLEINKKP